MDFSQDLTLENERARLRPLTTADYEALLPLAAAPALWVYSSTRADDAIGLAAYIAQALEGRERDLRYPFVIIDKQTGRVAGSTSFYNVSAEEARLSIGFTWLAPEFQRTGLNRACKYLLLRYAFEELGCERVELETDARNVKSREAMRRLGATEEGTLRSHRYIQGGGRRDTVIFSIICSDWDELRATIFGQSGRGRG